MSLPVTHLTMISSPLPPTVISREKNRLFSIREMWVLHRNKKGFFYIHCRNELHFRYFILIVNLFLLISSRRYTVELTNMNASADYPYVLPRKHLLSL